MEMSCDEAVMDKMDKNIRARYAQALLRLATGKKVISGVPLAFGEGDTKSRVKNVVKYKKPVIWTSIICVILVSMMSYIFMSNEKKEDRPPTIYAYYEYGVVPMNIGSYSWNGVVADTIHPTEMTYKEAISYNENKGKRNANIILGLNYTEDGRNSKNIKGQDEIDIVNIKRYKDGTQDLDRDMKGGNWIDISLDDESSYIYEFEIRFKGGNSATYSVKVSNNLEQITTEESLLGDLPPMVMINNVLYFDTNNVSNELKCGVLDGEITSEVDSNETPTINNQSNFGTGFGYQIWSDDTVHILINEKWMEFKSKDNESANTLEKAINKAILENKNHGKYDFMAESHVTLATEASSRADNSEEIETITAYMVVMKQGYNITNNIFTEEFGTCGATAITFDITQSGEYILKEYWKPRDGAGYIEDINDKFPPDAAALAIDDRRYTLGLIQNCYAEVIQYGNINTDVMISEIINEIKGQKDDPSNWRREANERDLTYFGDYMLHYAYDRFLTGNQVDENSKIMEKACRVILNQNNEDIDIFAQTGQEWFDAYYKSVKDIESKNGVDYVKQRLPKGYLLLNKRINQRTSN